ncbi:Ecm33 domain-containing protein [Anopheles sinensis]|uniref:Ecm33 domain-containing protein n=1 Tax=Anopheles sinensis TaxID=74873 RepID=A0A084WI41_ANOSI|nr:Ecm33 domain-containing protein [Anopheles sinensis]
MSDTVASSTGMSLLQPASFPLPGTAGRKSYTVVPYPAENLSTGANLDRRGSSKIRFPAKEELTGELSWWTRIGQDFIELERK